jgi:hypothetical protein
MTVEQLRSFSRNVERNKKPLNLSGFRLVFCAGLLDRPRGGNIGVLPRSRRTAKTLDQAAGLNSLVALALMGSTVSVATRWVNSVSALALAVKVSNCLRA